MKLKALLILVAIIIAGLYFSVYIVDEREQVVITQFGKSIGDPINTAGIRFKLPYQTANFFPKNLLEWDGDPNQIQTLDKRFIWVDSFARWRIVDPLRYFQTVTHEAAAQASLDGIINSSIRNAVTSNILIETVRNTDRELPTEFLLDVEKEVLETEIKDRILDIKMGRQRITRTILEEAQPKLKPFGIELLDVKIKRLNYEESVQQSVFGRMIAERQKIAELYRSEGAGEARKVEGDTERDLKQITSEAYRRAQEIKGKADAEATLIYARAFGLDPDFYSFVQTLDIYKETLDKDTYLILSTDSDFLKFFKGYGGERSVLK